MENSCRCDICNVVVHRASYAKHFRSKKRLEIEMIIPERLFQESIENKPNKVYNPEPLREKCREKIRIDDKQLNKELAEKMINPFYFTARTLQIAVTITLDSHHFVHVNSKLTIEPN